MSFCKICQEEINADSQYINGYWYHNNCIEHLQEENKELKDKIRNNEKCRRKMQKTLQQRIDKAIEYIKKCRDYHKTYHNEDKMFPDELTSLIIILQGDDE